MMLRLAAHPEVWERVYADAEYAPAVIEEVLRLDSTAPGPVRKACPAFTYQDREFRDGEVLVLSIWSANRDQTFWGETASQFDPDRENAGQHLSFGHAPTTAWAPALPARNCARHSLRSRARSPISACSNLRRCTGPGASTAPSPCTWTFAAVRR